MPAPKPQHIEHELTPHPMSGAHGVAVVLAGVLALILDASATNMINTGLPFLEGRVAATPDEGSWLLTSFNATYYATILLSPWLFVRFGQKRLLLVALGGFAATSLLMVSVTSFDELVALRAIQGVFAGGMFVPAALLMFLSLPPKMLPVGIPAFAVFSLAGASLGALIGGYFAETYGAASVFVPGAVATIAIGIFIAISAPNGNSPQYQPFDVCGVALSLLMFGSMQYLANEGARRNWLDDGSVVIAVALLIASVTSFIAWELYGARYPHVNLHLFATFRNLTIGGLVNVVVGFIGFGITVFVTYLEQTLGASATTAGQMIALRIVTYLIGIPLAYFVVIKKWLDIRAVVTLAAIGTALSFAGFWRMMTVGSALESFIAISLVFGIFFGALNQPTPSLVLAGLPPRLLLGGLAIYKVSSPIGSMLAYGVCQTFLNHRFVLYTTTIAGAMTRANPAVAAYLSHGGTVETLGALATSQATAMAEAALMLVLAVVTLLLIPIVMFAKMAPPVAAPPAPRPSSNGHVNPANVVLEPAQ
jgi:MFS transporter, DHA2 family, multidrug resistance protein